MHIKLELMRDKEKSRTKIAEVESPQPERSSFQLSKCEKGNIEHLALLEEA